MLEGVEKGKIAYLIGYLAGDGNFSNGWGKRKDRLSVTTVDVEFVEWISENIIEFSMDNPKLNNNVARGIYATQSSYVKTFPASYSEEFKMYGVLALKENRRIQNIAKKDMRQWLRGFLDADGHISYSIRKDRGRLAAKAGFTHPSEELLGQVQKFLMDELNIPSAIKPKKGEKCFTLSFSKLGDVKKFGEFVYQGGKEITVYRKYKTFKEMCDVLADRVERGITFPKEFMDTVEYHEVIGAVSRFMFVDNGGNEYPSAKIAANAHGIEKGLVHQRCRNNANGWTRRPKTEYEKREFDKYVNRQCKKLFREWLEKNENYY